MAVAGLASSVMSASAQEDAGEAAAAERRAQGQSALYEGALDQELRNLEAKDISTAAQNEADNIKRQAMLIRGQMRVAQSGSGVVMGEGSAQAAFDQLDTLSSADALAALFSGVNKSVSTRASGRFSYERGQQTKLAGERAAQSISQTAEAQATGTLLGGALKAGTALYGTSTLGKSPTK
ncbi:MAG: hypothetical protein V4757_06655 [Pseudomonadota bacterium]